MLEVEEACNVDTGGHGGPDRGRPPRREYAAKRVVGKKKNVELEGSTL